MHYAKSARRAAGLILAGGMCYVPTVVAQQKALEEIVVTAQRREQSLQTTPLSVSALSDEQIRQQGLSSLLRLDTTIPNVVINSNSLEGEDNINISVRGIGQGRRDISTEIPVGIYIDDIYYPQSDGGLLQLLDVERIEVLRGPQGTLFGKNATAGAVRYITKKPQFDSTSGYLKLTGGDYDRHEIQGLGNFGGDRLAGRISAAVRKEKGFMRRAVDGVTLGDRDEGLTRLQLRWAPSDKVEANFSFDYTRRQHNGNARDIVDLACGCVGPNAVTGAGKPVTGGGAAIGLVSLWNHNVAGLNPTGVQWDPASILTDDRYTVEGGDPEPYDFRGKGASLSILWNINDVLSLKSLSGIRRNDIDTTTDYDGSMRFNLYTKRRRQNNDSWSQELQLTGNMSRWNWVSGLYLYNDSPYEYVNFSGAYAGPPTYRRYNIRSSDVNGIGLYANATYAATDKLALTFGARETADDKYFAAADSTILNGRLISNEVTFRDLSPRFSVQYQWTNDIMTYFTASKGFLSGGINGFLVTDDTAAAGCQRVADFRHVAVDPAAPCEGINYGAVPFNAEDLWNYEIGLRSDLLHRRLRLNSTVFYLDDTNRQVTTVEILGRPLIENIGKAHSEGWELEMTGLATDNLVVNASYGFLDAVAERCGAYTGCTGETTQLGQAPRNSWSLGVRYFAPLANGGELSVSTTYGWKARQENADQYTPDYSMATMRLEYRSRQSKWTAGLFCNNCTNELVDGGTFNQADSNGVLLWHVVQRRRPREVGIDLRVNFADGRNE